jgi:hypothetical protein
MKGYIGQQVDTPLCCVTRPATGKLNKETKKNAGCPQWLELVSLHHTGSISRKMSPLSKLSPCRRYGGLFFLLFCFYRVLRIVVAIRSQNPPPFFPRDVPIEMLLVPRCTPTTQQRGWRRIGPVRNVHMQVGEDGCSRALSVSMRSLPHFAVTAVVMTCYISRHTSGGSGSVYIRSRNLLILCTSDFNVLLVSDTGLVCLCILATTV